MTDSRSIGDLPLINESEVDGYYDRMVLWDASAAIGSRSHAIVLQELATLIDRLNGGVGSLGYTPLNPALNLTDLGSITEARSNLGLVPGSTVQPWSARLADITAAFPTATSGFFLRKKLDGSGLEFAAAATTTSWGSILGNLSDQNDLALAISGKQDTLGFNPLNPANNLSDVANPSTARTNLGVAIGTNVQAYSGHLDDIVNNFSGATNGYFIRKKSDGSGLEFAQVSTSTTWGSITGTLSSQSDLQSALTGKQASSSELTGLAGLSTTGFLKRTGAGTYSAASLVSGDIPDLSSAYTTTTAFSTHTSSTGNSAHIPSGGVTDTNVATGAAIAWSKINKSGAVASDVGAISLTSLSAGTGLSYNNSTGQFSALFYPTISSPSTGDLIRWNGTTWVNWTPNYLSSLSAGTGISVSGNTITNTGIVSLTAGTGISVSGSTINALFYPTITSPTTGDRLRYNGSAWVNAALSSSDVTTALGYTPLNPANNLSEVTASSARSNLGLVIGTNVQAYSARLSDIADNYGSASSGNVLVKGSSGLSYTSLVAGSGIGIAYDSSGNTLTFTVGGYSAATISDTWTINSGSLAAGASVIVSTSCYSPFTVRRISTTYPARVRVYLTNALATADLSRLTTVKPIGQHGCLLDIVTTASYQTLDLSPIVQLYSIESPNALYVVFTNLDSVTRNIPAVFNIYR